MANSTGIIIGSVLVLLSLLWGGYAVALFAAIALLYGSFVDSDGSESTTLAIFGATMIFTSIIFGGGIAVTIGWILILAGTYGPGLLGYK